MHLHVWDCGGCKSTLIKKQRYTENYHLRNYFQIILLCWQCVGPDRFKMNNVINFGGKYIFKDDKMPSKYNAVCEKMIE